MDNTLREHFHFLFVFFVSKIFEKVVLIKENVHYVFDSKVSKLSHKLNTAC